MIFTTYDEDLQQLPKLFGELPCTHWSRVVLATPVPWFFIDCRFGAMTDDHWRPQLVLSAEALIVTLEAVRSSSGWVNAAYLVSPRKLNGTPDWIMEPLRQIWTATGPRGADAVILLTQTGRRYVDCATTSREADLVERRERAWLRRAGSIEPPSTIYAGGRREDGN